MKILGDLALVLLIVVGYSTGSVLKGKGKKVSPAILDVLLIVVSWIIAFSFRFTSHKWFNLLIWILLEICIGALTTWIRDTQYSPEKNKPAPAESNPLKNMWNGWMLFANRLGNYQSRIWLAFIYFVLMVPFGIIMRLFMNPWKTGKKTSGTAWIKRESTKTDLLSARNQY